MKDGRIILQSSREEAHLLSKQLLAEESQRTGVNIHGGGLLAVHENVLTGRFGLHARDKYWANIRDQDRFLTIPHTPLWVDVEFITGAPFFAVGLGHLGFGTVDPLENRRILQAKYSPRLVGEIQRSGVRYTMEVAVAAKRLIDIILANPANADRLLAELRSDYFEELVAELLIGHGCDVTLTPKTRDRGKDIIAAIPSPNGRLIGMVECKRRAADSTLGPFEARALLGQFYYDNTRGSGYDTAMLVTTARSVGPTAAEFDENLGNFDIKDLSDIKRWIQQYGEMKGGLWLPKSLEAML